MKLKVIVPVKNVSDDPDHPWYVQEENQFYDLEDELVKGLTPERIKQIVEMEFETVKAQQLRAIKEQIFNSLSQKLKVRWITCELEDLLQEERRIKREVNSNDQWLLLDGIEKEREVLEKQLRAEKFRLNPPQNGEIGINEIQQAKEVPISQFIEFKNKKARCLWHDDQHPSMYYYMRNNTVKCFSCQAREDVIGVVMKLFSLSFIDAVKKLIQ